MLRTTTGVLLFVAVGLAGPSLLAPASADTWDEVLPLTADAVTQYMGYGFQHTVAADTRGDIHVVWYDNSSGTNQVWYRKREKTTGDWLPATRITNQSSPVYRPAIACDNSGNVHVVWYHSSTGVYGIWYKKWDAATQMWGDSVWLHNPGGNYLNYLPSVACRPAADNVHVAWYSRDADSPARYQAKHVEYVPGTGWGSPTVVSADSAFDVSVAVDSADNVYMTWLARPLGVGSNQVHFRAREAGMWGDAEVVSNTNLGSAAYSPGVAVDVAGRQVHVVWNQDPVGSTSDRVYCRTRQDGIWGETDTVSVYGAGIQYSPCVTTRHDGSVHVAWRGYTASSPARHQIQWRCRTVGEWQPAEELTSRTAGSSGIQNPCIVCDRGDGLHIVWYDDSDGDNDVYYLRGDFADVALVSIAAPTGRVQPNAAVVPAAAWRNNGAERPRDFRAWCFLENPAGVRVYAESLDVAGLGPGRDTVLRFPEFNVGPGTGDWSVRCSTRVPADRCPANDTLGSGFRVAPGSLWDPGWQEVSPVPLLPSGKSVKDGSWLAALERGGRNIIYVLKGHKTGDFYCFDPVADTWRQLPSMPNGTELKPPRRGSAGAGDGARYVYATKGNNTLGYWRYDADADSWEQLPDVPLGTSGKKVKGGTDLVRARCNDAEHLYLLKGFRSEFYRYDVAARAWTECAPAPAILGSRKWDRGSWAVAHGDPGDPDYSIYAHRSRTHEFWRYDIAADTWFTAGGTQLPAMPYLSSAGKNKKARDGGAAAVEGDSIFALKGGSTCEFWLFDVAGISWLELDTMPSFGSTGKRKRVKDGGDIVGYGGGAFFALKGNKTSELWRYVHAPAARRMPNTADRTPVSGCGLRFPIPNGQLAIPISGIRYPVSGILSFTVYNTAGRAVLNRALAGGTGPEGSGVRLDLSGLGPGVYVVRIAAGELTATQKLVRVANGR